MDAKAGGVSPRIRTLVVCSRFANRQIEAGSEQIWALGAEKQGTQSNQVSLVLVKVNPTLVVWEWEGWDDLFPHLPSFALQDLGSRPLGFIPSRKRQRRQQQRHRHHHRSIVFSRRERPLATVAVTEGPHSGVDFVIQPPPRSLLRLLSRRGRQGYLLLTWTTLLRSPVASPPVDSTVSGSPLNVRRMESELAFHSGVRAPKAISGFLRRTMHI
ncbi:hypothetical protein MPTK2_3g01490 [Marchantia polymorpha subsp. ruderalis]